MGITRRAVKGAKINIAENDANFDFLGGGNAPTLVTISGGIVTINGAGVYRIETEAAAAIDTLDRINLSVQSDFIEIRPANDARQVMVAHGTWLKLANQQNLLLPNIYSAVIFRSYGSDVLVERLRVIHL